MLLLYHVRENIGRPTERKKRNERNDGRVEKRKMGRSEERIGRGEGRIEDGEGG